MQTYKIMNKARGANRATVFRRHLSRDDVLEIFEKQKAVYDSAIIDHANNIIKHELFVMYAESEQ